MGESRRHGMKFLLAAAAGWLLAGCYAAAWDAEKLDRWSSAELPESVAGLLPDLSGRDEVRVLVFGDSGKPESFTRVAGWMQAECAGRCDLALMLGDNFYLRGPSGPSPADFREHFSEPMMAHGDDFDGLPVWAVLGNHAYVYLLGRPRSDPAVQLAYTAEQDLVDGPLWLMPAQLYSIPGLPDWLTLVGIDSFFVADERSFDDPGLSWEEARDPYIQSVYRALDSGPDRGWRVLFGHHPHITVGDHTEGNRMLGVQEPFVNILPAIYFSGHDHDQQVIEAGGLIQVVQGAASKTRASGWGAEKAEAYFHDDVVPAYRRLGQSISADYCEKLGFAIAVFRPREFELTFFWGKKDDRQVEASRSWAWRLGDDGLTVERIGGAGQGFTNVCPPA